MVVSKLIHLLYRSLVQCLKGIYRIFRLMNGINNIRHYMNSVPFIVITK